MLIKEITTSNKALLRLIGIDEHSIINPDIETYLAVLLKANSPTFNRGYIHIIDEYIKNLEHFISMSFDEPDPDIDQLKTESFKYLEKIKKIKEQLRF